MISAVVLAKNEEKNIKECFKNLLWCDEIIVIDDNSEDRTIEIAKGLGATVFGHPLNNDFSEQRNFGLSKAKNEWVLFIDADERVTSLLRDEIKDQISLRPELRARAKIKDSYDGFYIKRRDFMWGRELKHGETGNIKLLRLARKDAGDWEGKVHEEWKIKGKIRELENPILHYPHRTITEFLKKINFYTDIRAKELYEKGVKVNFFSIIAYPKAKFFVNYFLKLGFLDGMPGLLVAFLMSFHSFLVRGKLWMIWQRK